jgi:hypothetical protein
LLSDTETCGCGGVSQYAGQRKLAGIAAALAELERRRDPPAVIDVHDLDPCPLCDDQ